MVQKGSKSTDVSPSQYFGCQGSPKEPNCGACHDSLRQSKRQRNHVHSVVEPEDDEVRPFDGMNWQFMAFVQFQSVDCFACYLQALAFIICVESCMLEAIMVSTSIHHGPV